MSLKVDEIKLTQKLISEVKLFISIKSQFFHIVFSIKQAVSLHLNLIQTYSIYPIALVKILKKLTIKSTENFSK